MNENGRVWTIGGVLILAGTVMAAVGASIDVVEVRAAVPVMGAALAASGLTAIIVRLPLKHE